MSTRIELDSKAIGLSMFGAEYEAEHHLYHAKALCHRLKSYVLKEKQEPYSYETPASWWDALKLAKFPKWALRRWPAKYTTHNIGLELIWPQLRTAIPPRHWGGRVTLLVQDRPSVSFMPDHEPISMGDWDRKASEITFKHHMADGRKCPCCQRLYREDF